MAFFSNTNVMINFFQNLALFRVKNANIFAKFFGENIFKIVKSTPGLRVVHLNRVAAFPGDLLADDDLEDAVAKLELLSLRVREFRRSLLGPMLLFLKIFLQKNGCLYSKHC
jgi:hypothetical protein